MLRRSFPLLCSHPPGRICFLTDVEGDMRYFQRFVAMSAFVKWSRVSKKKSANLNGEMATAEMEDEFMEPAGGERLISQYDIQEGGVHLAFKDEHTHFVYGGDAFDHGADLSFGTALLDFKHRFPDRVHFILGNRDINKMVMIPALQEVEALSPADAERHIFPHDREPTSLRPAQVHYAEFLEKKGFSSDVKSTRVTFLQWALESKMGSPHAFENRRSELSLLRRRRRNGAHGSAWNGWRGEEDGDTAAKEEMPVVTDLEVAESFFDAARPGGVYYEYIRQGVLALPLGGILFVHGGVNASNVGFVPDKTVLDFAEQETKGRRFLDEGKDALAWIKALNEFKEASFQEWSTRTGNRGEVVRRYVFPRDIVPYSVTVGSFVDGRGPQCVPLAVVGYLLESGLHTICAGHQPTGDSPAIARQPGGFLMIDGDNSYCGRGNEFSTPHNQRGLAVQEVVFRVDTSGNGRGNDAKDSLLPSHGVAQSWDVGSVVLCGLQADGRPFHFNLDEHPLIGRCVGEDWWVKLPLYRSTTIVDADAPTGESALVPVQNGEGTGEEAPFYELHRTRDGYRSEEVKTVTTEKLKQLLMDYQKHGHVPLPGDLKQRYSKEELAEVHVHRIKTKVSATPATASVDGAL